MNDRSKILDAIKKNKPLFIPEPSLPAIAAQANKKELLSAFILMLQNIGGEARVMNNYEEVKKDFYSGKEKGGYWVNAIPELGKTNEEINGENTAQDLAAVDYACISGTIGVAENAAIWIDEKQMVNRLLPFICQHLSVVLHADNIVANMHEAYDRIDIQKQGYGVFIAGPSKTADIEQSLVIGAHGSRSLVVYLVNKK